MLFSATLHLGGFTTGCYIKLPAEVNVTRTKLDNMTYCTLMSLQLTPSSSKSSIMRFYFSILVLHDIVILLLGNRVLLLKANYINY
jgi:hypothetical protein